jgi:hypothetical protein
MMDFDLKQVFSILDENNEGQIELRRFVDVANNYYSDAEQLARITKALDPGNSGLINYEQFCEGIAQISSLQGLTWKEVASDLTRRSRENSLVEDSDRRSLNQDGSTTTFNEYDESEENDTAHHPTTSSKTLTNGITTSAKKPTTTNNNKNSNQNGKLISPIDFNPALDSAFFGRDEEFTGEGGIDTTTYSSSDSTFPRATPQRISQSLKRATYLQPLVQIDQDQLQDTVDELRKTVDTLTTQKQTTTDRLSKIQSENSDLKSRLLSLEDRFHDLEGQQAHRSRTEQQKYVEFINQKDRTFLEEKETLQTRINAIEAELKETHGVNGQMKKDVKDLKQRLEDVDIQLHESRLRCNYLSEDNGQLLEQLRLQRAELEDEKLTNAQLAEQLQLESSRKMFGRTLSRTESIIKSSEMRIQDLDAQVRALTLDNQRLKHENDELREKAVVAGIDEGRRLMANRDSQSYAAELEVLSKDELMSKLREQFSVNDRLREYIERMLTVIIEHSPDLLEITTNSGVSIGMSSAASTKMVPTKKSPPLTATESTASSNSSLSSSKGPTIATPKQPADKYCRL